MTIHTLHTLSARLSAACASAALALRPSRKRHHENQAHKADLRDWENEGGNPAPASAAPATPPSTTGSA
jgi:hypothetical protein